MWWGSKLFKGTLGEVLAKFKGDALRKENGEHLKVYQDAEAKGIKSSSLFNLVSAKINTKNLKEGE